MAKWHGDRATFYSVSSEKKPLFFILKLIIKFLPGLFLHQEGS
jgi:hypothetical protein